MTGKVRAEAQKPLEESDDATASERGLHVTGLA